MLSPRLFISYSRRDKAFVDTLVKELQRRGFRIFLDTSDIDPGDNFVARLTKEIARATAIVAVISEHYSISRWAQAELYHALAKGKTPIPILLFQPTISSLDEPLQRLLRDTQYVTVTEQLSDDTFQETFAEVLSLARKRYRRELFARLIPWLFFGGALALGIWWAITHLNELDQARRRDSAIKEIVDAKTVLQHERIAALSSAVIGDKQGLGEIIFLSQDPARSNTTRFNALALGSELRKGQKSSRWYVQDLHIERTTLEDCAFINTSFIGGSWRDVAFEDCTFSGVFWGGEKGFSIANARFRNSQFFGGDLESVNAVGMEFINTKFRGATIDTTNFSKVRFLTETPLVEGNPVITPSYALFERSVLISRRTPPQEGVLDLTMTGDDMVFDNVLFVDCRLEGWFQPEWFRNSSFEHCELPNTLTKMNLAKTGNTVR